VTDRGRRRFVTAVALLLLIAGCGGDGGGEPTRLLDGSAPQTPPRALRQVKGAVLTTGHFLPASDALATACVDRLHANGTLPGPFVERIGVDGRSVTFPDGARLFACDAAAGAREGPAESCGGASGRRRGGVLVDPRLDAANCTDEDGDTVAFAWVEPAPDAEYVGIDRDGWIEVYAVRGGVPIRIATTDGIGDNDQSLGTTVIQYGPDGRRLQTEELSAQVAG
jgi:hypothetical protein